MERFLQSYNKECMKMAMLKHEETFREQVNELHRLYRVQKMLMRDLKRQQSYYHSQNDLERWNAEDKSGSSHSRPGGILDLECPAKDYIDVNMVNAVSEIEQESDVELTLATGISRPRKKEGTPFSSDSSGSLSSSSTESSGEKLKLQDWGLFQMPDMNMTYAAENRSSFNVEEAMRQDRVKQPSWHFQCLTLKMT